MYIDDYKNALTQLCVKNRVKSLYVFGSVLTSHFNNDSDIDMIVDIDSTNPLEYANYYFNLKFTLQDLLKRPIDLLENKAVRNGYKQLEIRSPRDFERYEDNE